MVKPVLGMAKTIHKVDKNPYIQKKRASNVYGKNKEPSSLGQTLYLYSEVYVVE